MQINKVTNQLVRFSILLISFSLFSGCAKEEIDPDEYSTNPLNGLVVKKADGVKKENVIHDSRMESYLASVNDGTISISSLYPGGQDIVAGMTIVFGITEYTPEGLVAKVNKVKTTEDRIDIEYTAGGIGDVFKSINYNISYFNTTKAITKRSFAVEKELFKGVSVEFSGTPATLDVTPEFGMNYEFVGIFKIDFENKTLDSMTYGFKNVEIEAGFNAKIFAHANEVVGKVSSPNIPLPPIQFLVAEIPVVINSRVAVNVSAGLGIKGGFDLDVSMDIDSFDAVVEISTAHIDGYKAICYNQNRCYPEVDFDITFNDLQGEASLTLAKQYAFEFTMYEAYDALSIGSGITLPELEFTTALALEDEKYIATINGKAGFPLEFSFKTEILDVLYDVFNSNGISTSFTIDVPTVDLDLFTKRFELPCDVQMNNSFASAECEVTGDFVKLTHGLESSNGSADGYKLNVDGKELGIFSYGTLHSTTVATNTMKYLGTVSMRDASSPGCRVELRLSNPCDLLSYCEADPAVDLEGQEYCYQTMADNRQWLNSSLVTSFGGTAGICHSNDPNACAAIGRYYQYDELGADVCPLGWHVPSKDEWQNMLTFEAQSVGSTNAKVDHLLAPNLPNFGSVSYAEAKGFNILPTGMYQGWKEDIPIKDRFTGSVFDSGEEYGYLWTSTALDPGDNSNEFSGEGAWGLLMRSSGQYSFKKMSKKAGLVCRCIRN